MTMMMLLMMMSMMGHPLAAPLSPSVDHLQNASASFEFLLFRAEPRQGMFVIEGECVDVEHATVTLKGACIILDIHGRSGAGVG